MLVNHGSLPNITVPKAICSFGFFLDHEVQLVSNSAPGVRMQVCSCVRIGESVPTSHTSR